MTNSIEALQNSLQNEFSMPFVVNSVNYDGENHYVFYPENEGKELFEVDVHIQNRVRVVVHVYPQLHAGNMLSDMSEASPEKIHMFLGFAEALKSRGAKVAFLFDQYPAVLNKEFCFPEKWTTFDLRISKGAAFDDSIDTEEDIIADWAIVATSMILSLLNVTDVDTSDSGYAEGNKYQVIVNKYERNPINRELCLAIKGYRCSICGFDFEEKYGTVGRHFIHVHHLTPVSQMGPDYIIDPSRELIPVCPNCHAMLHRKNPPYTPEEVLEMLLERFDIS